MRYGSFLTAATAAACITIAAPDLQATGLARGVGALLRVDHGSGLLVHAHFRRATSYYCYPHVYWWFYRPYTQAAEGYTRCMPYFHYPPVQGRPPRANPKLK
jgi:hypothetical protein